MILFEMDSTIKILKFNLMCKILDLACPRQKYLWMQQPKIIASVLEKHTTVAIYTKKQKSTVLTSALGGATLIIAQDFRSRPSAEAFNLIHYRGRSNFLFCFLMGTKDIQWTMDTVWGNSLDKKRLAISDHTALWYH